ncbi:uncharacterized protein JCM15063_005700 [Sporobolomyces koalae]|uniref:uncharacterized protein n=1 Tax=Sporobolomyces koalae TaxID=500713 RepID=UPI003171B375
MASTLVGAPVSKGLITLLCACSLLAAITTTQHYFNVPFAGHPHISRDHQYWRFATRWFIWTNSSEILLSVLILWYASLEVERIWGSRKFASFLVVTAVLSSFFEVLALVLFSRSGLHTLPAGPFALVFAIVYQCNRLVPSLYTFEVFHPRIVINNRYPLHVLSLVLLTSQPAASTVLGLCGILASTLYTSTVLPLWLRSWRIPSRGYDAIGHALSPLVGQNRPFRRTNLVTFEEGLLHTFGGVAEQLLGAVPGGGGGTGTTPSGAAAQTGASGLLNVGGNAVRRRSAVQVERTATPRPPPAEAATAQTAPPDPALPRPSARLPPISGASFLSQWQAGLSGAPTQPSNEQIRELTDIFPHSTRQDIVQALQDNGLSVDRAAQALLATA